MTVKIELKQTGSSNHLQTFSQVLMIC